MCKTKKVIIALNNIIEKNFRTLKGLLKGNTKQLTNVNCLSECTCAAENKARIIVFF